MARIDNPFETDEVVGVVPADRAGALLDALHAAGLKTEVLHGQKSADRVDAEIDGDGILDTVMRIFQQGKELDALRELRSRLEDGDAVVRVLEVGDRAEEAASAIVDHDGGTIWHFGEWTYRKLHR